ncbi:NAD(P)/FAD-dependent oxidoreductase [Glycomyces artemisiae]|uniref:NADH dehydrogenase FAD-containing subunit n=1 Tax=Glycomyces artemisiae TaxID=1076443 RepID=A0A2T0UIU4_9ACTN|nr:FAD-dependent oxidoreductase [Glycomyces artemisiae]PRY57860.1 NADH dehydrogenase FAD-containing subunit [Glycomyces artemisiae]
MNPKHRITVLGAGYAGAWTAGNLARRLHHDDVEITVVNAATLFVERLRLHELAAGHPMPEHELAEVFAGTGIRLRIARVTAVDADARTVTLEDERGTERLEYDTLVYALGSTAAVDGTPGAEEHGHHVASRPAALKLRARLDELDGEGRVLVVGGNLTAIEAATEIAEARPGLRVAVATRGELGGWLGPKARRHLLKAFDRFGIEIHEHTRIAEVTAAGALTGHGRLLAADATVWAAGFAVHPIAAASGLAVRPDGRITVDRQMRSVSHPDVYAVGDAVFTIGDNGLPLQMSCASAGFTGKQALQAIIGDLTGTEISQTSLAYYGNHISLGRNDAILQIVNGARTTWALTRGPANAYKKFVVKGSMWGTLHPTFTLPVRRHRTAAAAARTAPSVPA